MSKHAQAMATERVIARSALTITVSSLHDCVAIRALEAHMPRLLHLLVSFVVVSPLFGSQTGADAPGDTTFYAVSYIEVMASSTPAAIAALKQYRDASRKAEGNV